MACARHVISFTERRDGCGGTQAQSSRHVKPTQAEGYDKAPNYIDQLVAVDVVCIIGRFTYIATALHDGVRRLSIDDDDDKYLMMPTSQSCFV